MGTSVDGLVCWALGVVGIMSQSSLFCISPHLVEKEFTKGVANACYGYSFDALRLQCLHVYRHYSMHVWSAKQARGSVSTCKACSSCTVMLVQFVAGHFVVDGVSLKTKALHKQFLWQDLHSLRTHVGYVHF